MIRGIVLMNGTVLNEQLVRMIVNSVLQTIKKELPEEAQTYEGYKAILEQAKERLEELKPTI